MNRGVNRGGRGQGGQRRGGLINMWRRAVQVPVINNDYLVGVAHNQLMGIVPDIRPLAPAVTPQLSPGLLVASNLINFRHAVTNAHMTIDYYLASNDEFRIVDAHTILGSLGAVIHSIHHLPQTGVYIAHNS
eukprot:GHVR01032484.1.p1 GENE.GHVR01032484.1~~GHVR01032484.1.p1  ORF type:complete len:142 (+),score=15.01 GHVR01032484.1:31-426(+)